MPHSRVLVEKFQADVLDWLRSRVEIVVVDPWVEPERWEREASQVDGVVSRKGKITREHMEKSRGRLKIVARTGVGVDTSRIDLDAAKRVAHSLIVGGLLKPDANISGLHDTTIVGS